MKQVFCSIVGRIDKFYFKGFFIGLVLLIMVPVSGYSQKRCSDPPSITLGESSGTTCYTSPVTISGNIIGGSATAVTISTDGNGSVVPASASSSPFDFTYIPDSNDAGSVVTITVITNNPRGSPCKADRATYVLTVISNPPPPVIENIIQTTCTSSTGDVELSGLPTYADWTVTTSPGGMTISGSGATAVIPHLTAGTYTFRVSVSSGCMSSPSAQAEINEQPGFPSPPLPGMITGPTCSITTGSVIMTGLPATGTWTLIRYPGTISTSGTGTSTTVTGLPPGTFNFTVSSTAGCVSGLSPDVIIPGRPPVPAPPVIGTIIQPTFEIPTGSVILNGLPGTGTWTIIQTPGDIGSTGSGTSFTVTGLEAGIYTFSVTNVSGCSSTESSEVAIIIPERPEIVITDPSPVCYPATADLTAPEITAGSTQGLVYTYWINNLATSPMQTPAAAPEGTFYIKGTTSSGTFDIKPVNVTVTEMPDANAGSDQILGFQYTAILEATLGEGESGIWFSDSGKVVFSDPTDPLSSVNNLSDGNNFLFWIVTNNVCPADTDKVAVTVGEMIIPTLITPNGDTKNEFFIINGIETLGKTELTVFDRKGIQIFRNTEYNNKWNGVDYNDNPLMNDTYFYRLKSSKGKSYSGYIVIRR
ncbi:MAG: gliding motility-associated C-terminal domain-containing protein [Bacteroidales bacterium]|nr:gliding motility-associated C-terminal domain-containing protein [Bacteroidales bacterium]